MAIYDFFLSRNGAPVTAETYVGHTGRLFYDDSNGVIRLSDGVTPGGLSIPITIASDTDIGGIKAGPGVTINSEGQILIDSTGLEFSFGNFTATTPTVNGSVIALLSSTEIDEDIVFFPNGPNGSIQIVGKFDVHAPSSTLDLALADPPIFKVDTSGQVQMLVPLADQVAGALEIVGNSTGDYLPPNQTGVIVHVTGNTGLPARSYIDGNNNYSILVGRRYNGSPSAPTAVLAGEVMFRIAAQASIGDNFASFGPARIEFRTTQDQLLNQQGGEVAFFVTPLNSPATSAIELLTLNAETGVTTRDITPQLDNTYNLGSLTNRWGDVYIGQSSLFIADQTTNSNIEITVNNGTLLASGVTSLNTNTMKLDNTTINTINTASNIQIGEAGDTGIVDITNRNVNMANFTGKFKRTVRDLGVIADASTVTVDFSTDAIVVFEWDNNFTLTYVNFIPGSVVKVIAKKRAGTGTDNFSLNGITAANVSTGVTSISGVAGQSNFVEFTCTGSTLGSVYAKL